MSHSSSRVKDQSAIARRKVLRKREQQAGIPVVVAKNRGEHARRDSAISEKTLRFGERYGMSADKLRAELAKLQFASQRAADTLKDMSQVQSPTFVPGATVRHKALSKSKSDTAVLVHRVESGPDAGRWFVRWDGTKTNAGPYVERNLVIV